MATTKITMLKTVSGVSASRIPYKFSMGGTYNVNSSLAKILIRKEFAVIFEAEQVKKVRKSKKSEQKECG